ncbi:hypothetical protein JCM8547_000724 [Rhodosporidiobolus lusitaniae]
MTAHMLGKAAQAAPASRNELKPSRSILDRALDKQLELTGLVLLAILSGNALSTPEPTLSTELTLSPSYHYPSIFSRFLHLSFRKPDTDLYYKGRDDAFYIFWWVIAFWFLRDALMRWAYEPLAKKLGIRQKKAVVRFAEQAWALTYCIFSFSLGLYINQTSNYRNLNTIHFWKDYPHDALPALTKWYYLVECAFWIQQIIVLNLEARRKDYVQMFAHHVITVILMSFSYVLNWTRIGNTILCTMDFSDIFFPLAKLFKYTGNERAADCTFAVFLVSWIATRHVIFGRILWAVLTEPQTVLEYAYRPQDGYFFSRNVQLAFALLIGALQLIMYIWLFMIFRVLYGMMRGRPAEDVRSDDEDDGEDEVEEENGGEKSGPTTNGSGERERKKDR